MKAQQIHDLIASKKHLLAMLASEPKEASDPTNALNSQQWSDLCLMASQHRLEPALHDALQRSHHRQSVPLNVREAWADDFRHATARALSAQITLLKIAKTLGQANIAYAALKGSVLAWHVYANPALRPMRDIDILVSPQRAIDAYDALIAAGFERWADDPAPISFTLEHNKSLPGLMHPRFRVNVELHSRLFEHQPTSRSDCLLFRNDDLLARRVWKELGAELVAFLPPTETLLHLIVHSAAEHHFDNGPLVLNDIAAILRCEAIDWPHFWAMAKEGSWQRACQLLLAMTETYHGERVIEWAAGLSQPVPTDIVENAALMMLQNFALRFDLAVQTELAVGAPLTSRLRLWKRLFPARHVIAAFANRPNTLAAWMYYPSWLLSRLKRTAAGSFNPEQRAEAVRAGHIAAWLRAS